MNTISVTFYINKLDDSALDVFAFFHSVKWNNDNDKTRMCYCRIGQHSECSKEYLKQCREADKSEYQSLLTHMINDIQYDNLNVFNKSI